MRRFLVPASLLLAAASPARSMTPDERKAYLDKLLQTIPDVPSFRQWLQKTGELPPDFDALPKTNGLPDPQKFPGGRFSIPNVRPGDYTLYAFADGVLGQFAKADVHTTPGGKPVDLGRLEWAPVRRGRQLWEVGVANRTGAEFMNGDKFFEPDTTLQYPRFFPNDVNFVVGKSDPARDWYFAHVPHNETPAACVVPFGGVSGTGRAAPYSVTFDKPAAPRGMATLRLAICGAGARAIDVSVNDRPAGQVVFGPGEGAITRHQVQCLWYERELAFDASLMKQGTNVLKLTVPAGPINNGVIHDYLGLELDESAR